MDYFSHQEELDVAHPIRTISVHKNRVIYKDELGVKSKQLNSALEKNLFIKALLTAH